MSLFPPTPAKVSVCNQHLLPDVLLKESPEDSSPSLHAKWSRNELSHQVYVDDRCVNKLNAVIVGSTKFWVAV